MSFIHVSAVWCSHRVYDPTLRCKVMGEKALSWVKTENAATLAKLGDPAASPLYDRILSILESKEKIPYVRKIGDLYYNFWQVEAQTRKGVDVLANPV